jgi:uncharacterized protein YifE (UPF0438 family)
MNDSRLDGFRVTGSQFYDTEHYPYGFARSGEFTIKQTKILSEIGRTLLALSEGVEQAITAEEIQFVKVCSGEIPAETDVEKTWVYYRGIINKPFVQVGSKLAGTKNSNYFLQSAY